MTRFREESEKQFKEISMQGMDVEQLNDTFSKICLQQASSLSIPNGSAIY